MLVLSDWRVQVSNPGADWLYSSSDKSCCRMSGEFKWQILQRSSWDKCWCWVTMESSRDKCWCEWLWRVQVTNPAAEFKRQMLVLSDWRVKVWNPREEWLESSSDKSCCRMSGEFKWQILLQSSRDKCWCWVTGEFKCQMLCIYYCSGEA
jgi:hypothetical protein